jgi:hypothetical protein
MKRDIRNYEAFLVHQCEEYQDPGWALASSTAASSQPEPGNLH